MAIFEFFHNFLLHVSYVRDVRDQFLHVETETQCTHSQFLILRLRLLILVSNFFLAVSNIETYTETFDFEKKNNNFI